MGGPGGGGVANQDTPTLSKDTPLSNEPAAEEYTTTASTPTLVNDSLTYVSFLNTVSSLLTSDGDKNKASHILHSPTDVLVTPFTPQGDEEIESTATVTVVTSEAAAAPPPVEEVVTMEDKSVLVGGGEMETVSADDVDVSQTVELVETAVTEC